MIKPGPEKDAPKKPVTRKSVTVTPPAVTKKMAAIVASSNAIKQKAYRDRKAMGGKTWDEFLAETQTAGRL